PANPPWSGNVARRLQVDTSDLVATSGGGAATTRYFGETIYVTQDDATAGNQNNNASYREVTTSSTGTVWNFAVTGATTRMQSALRAWPVIDAGVTTVDVQVPSDGLFIVAYKV